MSTHRDPGRGRVRSRIAALRTSLVAVPGAYLGGALVLIGVAALLGGSVGDWAPGVVTDPALAQSLLPSIGAATLSLAGFVLTITALSLQFSASSYAPRLVEDQRRDPVLQHTLGAALATSAFCFGVLLVVDDKRPGLASISVLAGLFGSAVTLLLFVLLLDRLTAVLRPGVTMRRVTRDAVRVIPEVYPDEDGDSEPAWSARGPTDLPDCRVVAPDELGEGRQIVREGEFGLLVAYGFDALVDLAHDNGVYIDLTLPVGAFLQQRETVAVIRGGELAEDGVRTLLGAILVDVERTVDHDPAYPLRLLVDVALRALSPGINDPTTAVQSLDHLEQILLVLAERRLGPRVLRDGAGTPRVAVPAPVWEAYLRLAYVEIAAMADGPQISAALERSLDRLAQRVPAARRTTVERLAAELSPIGG